MNNILTNSRLASLRSCPRQHYYRYDLGLTRERVATPLRIGQAYHLGLEAHAYRWPSGETYTAEDAVSHVMLSYPPAPEWADLYEWEIECQTVGALLEGHFWRYSEDNFEIVENELTFQMPLMNPQSNRRSRTFILAGKIDKIVRLPDGRLAVLEYKTTGHDIGPDSDYWQRLRCDGQISLYVLAARYLGHNVETVIYDVARKPTIKPKQIPVLDDDGLKIVLDENGDRVMTQQGKPRQTAGDGMTLQSQAETPEQWHERLLTDIYYRSDYYYARREVPRLEDELVEYQYELWQQAKQLIATDRYGRWYRNVGWLTCKGCQYADLCLDSVIVDLDHVPVGFVVLDNVHPELDFTEGENNEHAHKKTADRTPATVESQATFPELVTSGSG